MPYLKCLDRVVQSNNLQSYSKWSEGHDVLVYMEPLANPKPQGSKSSGNVWRVSYTEPVAGIKTFALHLPDKERARYYFDQAIAFNGFLGLDEQGEWIE